MTGVRLSKTGFFINLILQFAFTSLYYISASSLIEQIVGSSDGLSLIAIGTFHLIIVITLLVCMVFIQKINEVRNIYRYSIAMLATFISLLLFPEGPFGLLPVFIAGVFFAISQLLSFTYFWSVTVSEERGRIAGFIGFLAIPLAFIVSLMAQFLDLFGIVMLAVFLILGILATNFLKPEEYIPSKKNEKKVGSYHEKRTVFLYTIPWIIFSIVNNTFDKNISFNAAQSVPEPLYVSLALLQLLGVAFGALGGGIIADLFGRKLSLSFSLTLYGFSTALGGFAQNIEIAYFVYLVNGLTWGILWSLYGLVVWGDLANGQDFVKRYSVGLVIFYLPLSLGAIFSVQILQMPLIWSALVGCSLIFLSNVPLFLAPELLSEDFRNEIKLKLHMNVVKKLDRKLRSQG